MKYHPRKVYVESAGQEFILKYGSSTYLLRNSTVVFVLALRPFHWFLFHFHLSCGLPGYLLPERWQWTVMFSHICLHLLYCNFLWSSRVFSHGVGTSHLHKPQPGRNRFSVRVYTLMSVGYVMPKEPLLPCVVRHAGFSEDWLAWGLCQ